MMDSQIEKLEQEIQEKRKKILELKKKRREEIGKLAEKCNIENIPNDFLEEQFKQVLKNYQESQKSKSDNNSHNQDNTNNNHAQNTQENHAGSEQQPVSV